MKNLLFISFVCCSIPGFSQELLSLGRIGADLDFERPEEYRFIKIDTNNLWFITEPGKEILFLPPNAGFGSHALLSDTSLYYRSNTIATFQFKLQMQEEGNTYLINFDHKYDFEKNIDGGIIETSYDNGLTWQNIIFDTIIMNHVCELRNFYSLSDTILSLGNQPGFTGTQSSMTLVIIEFYPSEYLREDTMTLRFKFGSDSNNTNNEGWMLDLFHFGGQFWDDLKEYYQSYIKIHPVPANDRLLLESEYERISHVEVYSLTGQLLLSDIGNNLNSVDISKLNKGFYFLMLECESSKRWISKFCKI